MSASAADGRWRSIAWAASRCSSAGSGCDAGELERAHPQVTAGDAGQHGAGQHRLAGDVLARRHDRKGAGRRDAEGVHRLPTRCSRSIGPSAALPSPPGRRRAPRPLQVDVAPVAVPIGDLAEQERPAVAEAPERSRSELVAAVGLGDRRGPVGRVPAGQTATPRANAGHRRRPQLAGQFLVEHHQPRGRERGRSQSTERPSRSPTRGAAAAGRTS